MTLIESSNQLKTIMKLPSRKDRLAAEVAKEAASLPRMKIVHWRARNAQRRAAGKPLTGAYYWIPLPPRSAVQWDLMEFYDKDYPDEFVEHQQVWPEVLNLLAIKWSKPVVLLQDQLETSLYGLPRGRVVQMTNGQYGIAHGKDAPPSTELGECCKKSL